MYLIIERVEDKFFVMDCDLETFKEVLNYLKKRHKKDREEEETRIIYYETDEELEDLFKQYNVNGYTNERVDINRETPSWIRNSMEATTRLGSSAITIGGIDN